jgi:hypothetical protein
MGSLRGGGSHNSQELFKIQLCPCSSDKSVCNISYTCPQQMYLREGKYLINLFLIAHEYFKAYGRCREAATLFVFLMSSYSLAETCNIVQNCTFHQPARMGS